MSDRNDEELKKEAIAIVSSMAQYLSIGKISSLSAGELSSLKKDVDSKRQFLYSALLSPGIKDTETRRVLEHALRVVSLVSLLIAIVESGEMADELKEELNKITKDLRHGPGPIVEILDEADLI